MFSAFRNAALGLAAAFCALAAVALLCSAVAQEQTARILPDDVVWKDNPAFPKGVKIATLVGDPTKAGDMVVQRIKFPAHFQMPLHTHPFAEVVTVISGNIGSSHGGNPEKTGGLMQPGSLWVYPARHPHFAWTEDGEAVLQVQFIGPGGIDYVNPADDPRKK